jgi:hypothetical protein
MNERSYKEQSPGGPTPGLFILYLCRCNDRLSPLYRVNEI